MKLVYWKAECLRDGDCYSLRATTRKEVKAMLANHEADEFGPPKKIVLFYESGFQLMNELLSEDRGCALMDPDASGEDSHP